MKTDIKPHTRVRVTIWQKGFISYYFNATVVGWAKNGLVKVVSDKRPKVKAYPIAHIKPLHA